MCYHVAFEGFDGVGKTSAAKALAKAMNWRYVEKPLAYLMDPDGGTKNYRTFTEHLNKGTDLELRAMVYGAGIYYTSQIAASESITTDRHLCSMYSMNYVGRNAAYFDYLVGICGKPTLTVILYADPEVRRKRIIQRNPNDPDLKKVFTYWDHLKLKEFVEHYQMPHLLIDNTHCSIEETVEQVKWALSHTQSLPA